MFNFSWNKHEMLSHVKLFFFHFSHFLQLLLQQNVELLAEILLFLAKWAQTNVSFFEKCSLFERMWVNIFSFGVDIFHRNVAKFTIFIENKAYFGLKCGIFGLFRPFLSDFGPKAADPTADPWGSWTFLDLRPLWQDLYIKVFLFTHAAGFFLIGA